MKRILYLMHVPWGWIKQRPHFLAEYLQQYFQVDVRIAKSLRMKQTVINSVHHQLSVREFFVIPYSTRYAILNWLNFFLLRRLKLDSYDIIWCASPNLFQLIDKKISNKVMIVYDCMDDVLEFPITKNNISLSKTLLQSEKKLIERADIIFSTSEHLREVLLKRHTVKKNIEVIHNGIEIYDEQEEQINVNTYFSTSQKEIFLNSKKRLFYFGTIDEWMDFELIIESLKIQLDICYVFFGATEMRLPSNERIIFCGPVEHRYIFSIMKEADALVMPFKLNDLILSVNPVKLYEYVFSGKNTISINYPGVQQFKDFVHFYSRKAEFHQLVDDLVNDKLLPKKNRTECIRFAKENSWNVRTQQIAVLLNNKLNDKSIA